MTSCALNFKFIYLFGTSLKPYCRYVFLLADFESNTIEVNKAVLKLLHRIAFDLKMAPRLYQVIFHPTII